MQSHGSSSTDVCSCSAVAVMSLQLQRSSSSHLLAELRGSWASSCVGCENMGSLICILNREQKAKTLSFDLYLNIIMNIIILMKFTLSKFLMQ